MKRRNQKSQAEQPDTKKMGRPLALVDDEKTINMVLSLARIQCTTKEAAAVLGVTKQTFYNFLDRFEKAREAWENGQEQGRASLRRTQFEMASKNAAMAIWLGKQWLDQKDRKEVEVGSPGDFDKLDAEQLREYISRETEALGVSHRPAESSGRSRAVGKQLN